MGSKTSFQCQYRLQGMGIVRIPLDYYRILGLPIQATAEQLQQAHRDRTQQLPRREFSEAAILARRQLIDQAYSILSDATQRQEYDTSFLAKSYDLLEAEKGENPDQEAPSVVQDGADPDLAVDPYTPSIEIDETQFVGALLILLELGEYELVLRLGYPYLGNSASSLGNGKYGEPEIVSADIVLTVALAYLELGREQWQQGQYENAALSLESGQELLLREGIFANIRGEMQTDLFKLRPYRILELVSLPDEQEEMRRQGISLLEDMLHDRSGIDGVGDDLSGLGVDDFLRFIQQLRSYLTAAEQQTLFETEARRPSAVAIYLAVYALLARGFAQCQPVLIRRAKLMLMRLGTHQDVHLEQAVCSLLLGQTEEASRALELSQEFESLAFIRDHSQGSPDLLPGLCLYSERWFQNEVFPHFRDLQKKQVSLTEYFADEEVQHYLEDLPAETEPAAAQWSAATAPRRDLNFPAEPRQTVGQNSDYASASGKTATIEAPSYAQTPVAAEPVAQSFREGQGNRSETLSRSGKTPARGKRPPQPPQEAVRQPVTDGGRPAPRRIPGAPSTLRLDRILMLVALGVLGLMLLGFLFKRLNRPQAQPVASGAGVETGVETAFSDFATQQGKTVVASAPLTEDNAPEIIKAWLDAKSAAMGESHEIDQLDQILVDPALAQQKARAEEVKESGSYWKFEHSKIDIVSVETTGEDTTEDTTNPDEPADATSREQAESDSTTTSAAADSSGTASDDTTDAADDTTDSTTDNTTDSPQAADNQQATVEAMVSEKADFYNNGQIDASSSYDSTVRVEYDLLRQDGQWRIEDMKVLE